MFFIVQHFREINAAYLCVMGSLLVIQKTRTAHLFVQYCTECIGSGDTSYS